ncbi:MAG: glycine zipper 2TM domain-containing protein [Gammaproteobacteria bacterium]|nr:glycine zipper 2TM domain-containing protein [Gammaproteobacteria bacterium]
MKRKMYLAGVVLGSLTLGGQIFAYSDESTSDYVDEARVINSVPIYQEVRVETPRRECWQETTTYYEQSPGKSITAEVIGGIVGGVVGNQFGSGSGRDIATVAGAVLGGSLAHDIERKHYAKQRSYPVTTERCKTVNEYHTEERLAGYRVTYEYDGRQYTTRTSQDPGSTIRVRVGVAPIEN